MFIADKLLYLELQKTGGSHICRLLEKHTTGRSEGKHNRMLTDMADLYVIGSIRNPWDWYVSLWAYGVSGQGAIRSRTGKRIDLDYYYRMLPKEMGKNWLTITEFITSVSHDIVKPVNEWQKTYEDSSNPEAFRDWLKLLLNPARRFDIGEGYGFCPLAKHAGLLSYRYFRLYTTGKSIFKDRRLASTLGLVDYDNELNLTQSVVRMESLEDDLILALNAAGATLSDEQIASLQHKDMSKTNTSKRHGASFYYDQETLSLVAEKDSYLIEKYAYTAPVLLTD